MASSKFAPTFEVPSREVVSVEHPCIIKNVEKGISMLGGSNAIKQVLEPGSSRSLGLSFHPEDPDSRPVLSLNNQTSDVLLRFTVPKRIGKRKRGSNEPFAPLDSTEPTVNANYLIQSLHDNLANCQVEPLGAIEQSHIWRSMPDFVYSTQGSEFLSNVKSNILPRDLPSLKGFDMHRTYGRRSTDAVPPPALSTVSFPQQYSYRQSTYAKEVIDHGTGQRVLKLPIGHSNGITFMSSIHHFDEAYPTSPEPGLPPLATQPKAVRNLYPILTELFNQRPIWTRRALLNHLPDDIIYDKLRFSLGYIAFVIRSGPWRDCICKLGVDPRTSPAYRKYQTTMIQMPRSDKGNGYKTPRSSDWARSADKTSHIFTGQIPQPQDGSIWQLCDIADPQLKAIVDIDESQLNQECENQFFGWYRNGTYSKIRTAMKAKIDALSKDERLDDSVFERFLAQLPEHLDYFNMKDVELGNIIYGYLPMPMTDLEVEMAKQYRGMIRYGINRKIREAQEYGGQVQLNYSGEDPAEEVQEDVAFDEPMPDVLLMSQPDTSEDTQPGFAFAFAFANPRPTAFEEAWNISDDIHDIPTIASPRSAAFEEAWSGTSPERQPQPTTPFDGN